jgi:hypothetical protein
MCIPAGFFRGDMAIRRNFQLLAGRKKGWLEAKAKHHRDGSQESTRCVVDTVDGFQYYFAVVTSTSLCFASANVNSVVVGTA